MPKSSGKESLVSEFVDESGQVFILKDVGKAEEEWKVVQTKDKKRKRKMNNIFYEVARRLARVQRKLITRVRLPNRSSVPLMTCRRPRLPSSISRGIVFERFRKHHLGAQEVARTRTAATRGSRS